MKSEEKREDLFKNEKIQQYIGKKDKITTEERARRKILVEKQKKNHKESEQLKKKAIEIKQQLKSTKLKQIAEVQKIIMNKKSKGKITKKPKRKQKVLNIIHKKKQRFNSPEIIYEFIPDIEKKPEQKGFESESEVSSVKEIKQNCKPTQQEIIAKKAKKIREDQIQLFNKSPNSDTIQDQNQLTDKETKHISEEEKQSIKNNWKKNIQQIKDKLDEYDSKKSNEYEKQNNYGRDNNQIKDFTLDRADDQFGGNISDQKYIEELDKEITKNIAQKDIEDINNLIDPKEEDKIPSISERRIQLLEEETKQITEQLKREIEEKNKIILSQSQREDKLRQDYQELLEKQSKELFDKVLEATQNLQSVHDNQINAVVGRLTERLEMMNKPNTSPVKPSIDARRNNDPELTIEKHRKSPGRSFEKTSFTEETYKKMREILAGNDNFNELKEVEELTNKKYKAKLDKLKELIGRIDPKEYQQKEEEITLTTDKHPRASAVPARRC